MKCNRVIVLLASCVLVVGFSAPVFAGIPQPECELTIEINALRGGSPTVPSGGTKDITSKARILKGTAEADATVADTTLTITTYDSLGVEYDIQQSLGLTLIVGRGGVGDKLTMLVPTCNLGDEISFTAHYSGIGPNGAVCEATSGRLIKSCK